MREFVNKCEMEEGHAGEKLQCGERERDHIENERTMFYR